MFERVLNTPLLKVYKKNSRHRYLKCKSTWYAFRNISVILANVWPRNIRCEYLWISSVSQHFRWTILKFSWLFLFVFFSWKTVICYLWYLNWFKNETSLTLEANLETYSEPCQISKMEVFAKKVNAFRFWLFLLKAPS